jgi:hypothetical protein
VGRCRGAAGLNNRGGRTAFDWTFLVVVAFAAAGINLAFRAAHLRTAALDGGWVPVAAGLTVATLGIAFRIWAILTLGRFFKFVVVIQSFADSMQTQHLSWPHCPGMEYGSHGRRAVGPPRSSCGDRGRRCLGQYGVEWLRHAVEVDRVDEQARVTELALRARAQEAPQLRFLGPSRHAGCRCMVRNEPRSPWEPKSSSASAVHAARMSSSSRSCTQT